MHAKRIEEAIAVLIRGTKLDAHARKVALLRNLNLPRVSSAGIKLPLPPIVAVPLFLNPFKIRSSIVVHRMSGVRGDDRRLGCTGGGTSRMGTEVMQVC